MHYSRMRQSMIRSVIHCAKMLLHRHSLPRHPPRPWPGERPSPIPSGQWRPPTSFGFTSITAKARTALQSLNASKGSTRVHNLSVQTAHFPRILHAWQTIAKNGFHATRMRRKFYETPPQHERFQRKRPSSPPHICPPLVPHAPPLLSYRFL